MPASNTRECFSEFVGQKVIGVLFDAEIGGHRRGTKTLVFEDGRGLTIMDNGSFWIDTAEDVGAAVRRVAKELNVTAAQLRDVLALAAAGAAATVIALQAEAVSLLERMVALGEDVRVTGSREQQERGGC